MAGLNLNKCPCCNSSNLEEESLPGTTEKTYREWIQKVGRTHWRDLVRLRMADRKGNLTRVDRPAITRKMKEMIRIVRKILAKKQPLFIEDLALNGNDLKALGLVPGPQYKAILQNLLGVVLTNPEKNDREWMLAHLKRILKK